MSGSAAHAFSPAALFDLAGQVALVTGSSRGLGWAMAQALAAAGARVVLNGRDEATLAARVGELTASGLLAEAWCGDAADPGAGSAMVHGIADRYGSLDILIANAATTVRKPALDQTDDDWARVIGADLGAPFRLARDAGRIMAAAGRGRIVFNSSINGMVVRPGMVSYAAAKTGLFGLVRVLAVELAPHGVTVNALAPGYFLTDGNSATRAADPGFEARIAARTPMGRWGRPEELAAAALFLASPASSYMTGSIVTVDGGLTVAI
jgi:gluconate 5-dehydrogenase